MVYLSKHKDNKNKELTAKKLFEGLIDLKPYFPKNEVYDAIRDLGENGFIHLH